MALYPPTTHLLKRPYFDSPEPQSYTSSTHNKLKLTP
jgi:hypothetical protein